MHIGNEKKKRRWPVILVGVLLVLGLTVFQLYRYVRSVGIAGLFDNTLIQEQIVKRLSSEHRDLVSILPPFLGFDTPRTYLLLFLNNTEMRPGGGFIGTYGVIHVARGQVSVRILDGVENLDNNAPATWNPTPPAIMERELGIPIWYFRDSNWSADFETNAKLALVFFTGEGGIDANAIDGVIAFTPTVLEELLRTSGPIHADGLTFDAESAVATLEYDVEYGYKDRGIDFTERKHIIRPFFDQLLASVAANAFRHPDTYLDVFDRMKEQKHIMMYAFDTDLQDHIDALGLTPRIVSHEGDYLQWVDANLAALKTDHAIQRHLTYRTDVRDGQRVMVARMTYVHTGQFDWRTSRYRTFARVYTAPGTALLEVNRIDARGKQASINLADVDAGQDGAAQWYGAFVIIEPGTTGAIEYVYRLPATVEQQFADQTYALLVQKQPGIVSEQLTLDIDFDTTITRAEPPEEAEHWGDTRYHLDTTITKDQLFTIVR